MIYVTLFIISSLLTFSFLGGFIVFLALIGSTWLKRFGEGFVMYSLLFAFYIWIAFETLPFFWGKVATGELLPQGITPFFFFVALFLPFLATVFDRFQGVHYE